MARRDSVPSPEADVSGETPQAKSPKISLGRVGVIGMAWMLLGTFVSKLSTLGAQVVLGIVLSQGDFGVYAAAIGIGTLVMGIRNGGAVQILVQKGPVRWRNLCRSVLYIASAINALALIVLLGVAAALIAMPLNPDAALGDPRVPMVLVVIGLSLTPAAAEAVFLSKLSVSMRFKDIARLNLIKALVQNGSMVVLALIGAGPFSFAIPLVLGSLFGLMYGYRLTRVSFRNKPLRRALWRPILARSKWLVGSAFGLSFFRQSDYLALGALVSAPMLGLYFFAYQLVFQFNILLAVNLQQVLLPVLTRMADDPERFRRTLLKVVSLLMLVGSGAGFAIVLTFDTLELLIWNRKWAEAVALVQLLAICLPFRMLWSVVNGAMMSRGMFRSFAGATALAGLGLFATSWAAATTLADIQWIVTAIVIYIAIGVTGLVSVVLRSTGISPIALLGRIVLPWSLAAIACMIVYLGIDASILAKWHGHRDVGTALLTVFCNLLFFSVIYIGLARIFMSPVLISIAQILPKRIASPMYRFLFLNNGPSHAG